MLAELDESVIPHHVGLVNIDTAPGDFIDVAMKEVIEWKQHAPITRSKNSKTTEYKSTEIN